MAHRSLRSRAVAKRVIDLCIGVPLCIVLAPLMVIIAVAIRMDSPGPALFRQRRRGRGMVPLTILKFRSLCHNAPDPSPNYEMAENDPRITRIGAVLRRTSLDELPQLLNVVRGSMSLVGPRPLVEWESQLAFTKFAERFDVKPGLTGLSQVLARNSVDFDARCEQDLVYVHEHTILLDLQLLLRTPATLLHHDNIYPRTDTNEAFSDRVESQLGHYAAGLPRQRVRGRVAYPLRSHRS